MTGRGYRACLVEAGSTGSDHAGVEPTGWAGNGLMIRFSDGCGPAPRRRLQSRPASQGMRCFRGGMKIGCGLCRSGSLVSG